MKMLLLFLLFMNVSQHALAVVVEVNEGERSVLLLCLYSGFMPKDPTVMWTRNDLQPKSVHLRGGGRDDLRGQNQHYSGRTSMNLYALITKDFSLTLRKPTITDSGNYTCSISAGGQERRLRDIQLQVKDQQMEVKVKEGSEFVILPCKTNPDLPEDTRVEWTRSDLGLMMIHEYSNKSGQLVTQDDFYKDRTHMNEDVLRTGDLSLTLKQPKERDTGRYICTIYRDKDILRQKVVLSVKEPFPSWAIALLVLLVLLVVSGGLLFYFRHYFVAWFICQVEVEEGVESVQLPFKTTENLPEDIKVVWWDSSDRKVHVYPIRSNWSVEQDWFYKNRTEMNKDLLKTGDLSLTLKHPTGRDSREYRCKVYGKINRYKKVLLKIKVPQLVEVDSEVEFVQLPCITTVHVPEDAKVEWTNRDNKKVHVYQNGSNQPEEQNQCYRDRTTIGEDLMKTGDLSLTLQYPTDWDTDTYTCTVYSRERCILVEKKVKLKVRASKGPKQLQTSVTDFTPDEDTGEYMTCNTRDNKILDLFYANAKEAKNDEDSEYRGLISVFVDWCLNNHLQINARKTKELVVDFRRGRHPPTSVNIQGTHIERADLYKYLGVHINNKLDWTDYIGTDYTVALYKEGQSRLHLLRRLRSFGVERNS
ncbi:uncharacterized protein LOC115776942 [Archocentrus centrarchus]|uniref:uncharacterized protein LOC115776942 n=1 Tax=Archocentrus centrarchus TaxID=63155 RepID=UPI0011EA2888|nr:uncharacterized protein LOC115776942 [Archocentrus centrarchus]